MSRGACARALALTLGCIVGADGGRGRCRWAGPAAAPTPWTNPSTPATARPACRRTRSAPTAAGWGEDPAATPVSSTARIDLGLCKFLPVLPQARSRGPRGWGCRCGR
jgi:hypothetical protein